MSRPRSQAALDRVERSRRYTQTLLDGLTPEEWFWRPHELVTHVAWQVGHLAVAEYNLCLRRIRGRTEADEALMPESFFERFKLGSTPAEGAGNNPPLADIQRTFDEVHRQALAELASRTDADLDVPVERPHPAFNSKLEAVEWCSAHELIHAGQIGLLRRLMGKPPLR